MAPFPCFDLSRIEIIEGERGISVEKDMVPSFVVRKVEQIR